MGHRARLMLGVSRRPSRELIGFGWIQKLVGGDLTAVRQEGRLAFGTKCPNDETERGREIDVPVPVGPALIEDGVFAVHNALQIVRVCIGMGELSVSD